MLLLAGEETINGHDIYHLKGDGWIKRSTSDCSWHDDASHHGGTVQNLCTEVRALTMLGPERVAMVGELLATHAKVHRVAALLVDAAVRDVERVQTSGLPIHAFVSQVQRNSLFFLVRFFPTSNGPVR